MTLRLKKAAEEYKCRGSTEERGNVDRRVVEEKILRARSLRVRFAESISYQPPHASDMRWPYYLSNRDIRSRIACALGQPDQARTELPYRYRYGTVKYRYRTVWYGTVPYRTVWYGVWTMDYGRRLRPEQVS